MDRGAGRRLVARATETNEALFDESKCGANTPGMKSRFVKVAPLAAVCLLVAACSEPGEESYRPACEQGLEEGFAALGRAEARGLKGSADWTRAASLLSAARVQKEFGEYQNCAAKAARAEPYLKTLEAG